VALLAENRAAEAARVVRLRNPFVSACGRVCDAACERRCRRSDVDQPIAIRALKRYAADNSALPGAPLAPAARGRKNVAVVGAGPAGLSCAYFLALMGRPSVVYESLPIAGGMLAVGIPEYRLPRPQLQADIDFILSHGVELRTSAPVASLESLRAQGFRSVFMATGAHGNRPLRIPGEDLRGVVGSLELLRARPLGLPFACGRTVAVIGGGNAAIDTARTALRLGARSVTILYRRTREEMPAYEEEIEAALAEGVRLEELCAPVEFVGAGGALEGITMVRMRMGDVDARGRRQSVPVEGSDFLFPCDMAVTAVGQLPSVEIAAGESAAAPGQAPLLALDKMGGVKVDVVTGATSAAGVFAGGDCVSGGATVIEAVAAGQRAAVSIDRMLGGAGLLPANLGPSLWRPTDEQLERITPRAREPELAAQTRARGFEEVLGPLSTATACAEASRCMRCDLERAAARASSRGQRESVHAARRAG
jgi:NADH-quinone oxidoreductase subunit F